MYGTPRTAVGRATRSETYVYEHRTPCTLSDWHTFLASKVYENTRSVVRASFKMLTALHAASKAALDKLAAAWALCTDGAGSARLCSDSCGHFAAVFCASAAWTHQDKQQL